jgi:heterodisulfide reductase subunit A
MKKRVGVFVCECGTNIAATVDTVRVAEYAKTLPGVVYSTNYKYMCSDPGQENSSAMPSRNNNWNR